MNGEQLFDPANIPAELLQYFEEVEVQCGAPYRRVVERERLSPAAPSGNREIGRWTTDDTSSVGGRSTTMTTGWQAGCSCDAGPPLACTTLDPFLGAGTTALVSKRLGRSCIGIELNPAYAEMARRRVASVPYALFSGASGTGGAAR